MQSHAEVFFLISSIGFVLLFLLGAVILVQVIGLLHKVRAMSEKLEDRVSEVSSDVKEFFADIRESTMYRFLFRKKKHTSK